MISMAWTCRTILLYYFLLPFDLILATMKWKSWPIESYRLSPMRGRDSYLFHLLNNVIRYLDSCVESP